MLFNAKTVVETKKMVMEMISSSTEIISVLLFKAKRVMKTRKRVIETVFGTTEMISVLAFSAKVVTEMVFPTLQMIFPIGKRSCIPINA